MSVSIIPEIREGVSAQIVDYAKGKKDCAYADIRIEVNEIREAYAEDGKKKERPLYGQRMKLSTRQKLQ